MKEKNKGPAAGKPIGPKRKAEANRLIKNRAKELEGQEVKLFLKFAETYPEMALKIDTALGIWNFLRFLKEKGYYIINGKTVFCVPFSHLADQSNLK